MSRNALHTIAAFALLCISTVSAVAQTPATAAQKFSLRNPLGETITLTSPASGVASYTLTFPSSVPVLNSLYYAVDGSGQIGALPPGTNGQVLSYSTSSGLTWTSVAIGSVTNVSAGNLSPLFTTNVANPTTTPTLSFSLNTQAANTFFAGPTAGIDAAPTFRALTATDVPALNYVSSVALGNMSPLFTTTNAGTALAPSFTFAPVSQAANLVYASPSGGAGNPTFRALTAADVPALPYVSSVALSLPASVFNISGSPVTSTGTLTGTFADQAAATVFAGPVSGLPGTPTFRALTGSDITGAALTKTDDANVTLTLGGSPSTALLNATSLTLGWNGLLSIARGGTNSNATPTLGGVAYGDGSAYQFTAAGSNGFVLRSNGAAAPTWVDPTSFVTGAALTESDDANVQLTLTGTPGTALLQGVNIAAGWSGVLSTARGGTGLGTIGTAGQVLRVNAGATGLEYATAANGTVTDFSAGDLAPLFTTSEATTTTTPALSFNLNTQAANTVFAGPAAGGPAAPTFRPLTGSDIAGSALTKIDDANVTLTLGGSPGTALLNAASITAGWTGQLSIARGGTGASTAPAALNNLLPTQAGNAGKFLSTDGAGNVTWQPQGAGSNWTLTGNSGTTAGTNFIGTTDGVDFVVKTNNVERVRVDAGGQVGFGRSTPDAMIDLNGGMIWRPDTISLLVGATHSGGANIRHDNVSIGDRAYIYIQDTASHYGNRISGFADGVNGKMLRIFNSANTTLTLLVDDANSSAANRIRNTVGDNGNVGIADSGFADLVYDGETQKWIIHDVSGPTSTAASGFTYFARKLVDQTLTNGTHGTTLQSSGMTVSIFPDIVHTVDGMLYFSCTNSNTDVKVAIDLPDGFQIARITALGHSDGGTNVVEGSDILDADNTASETFNVSAGKILFIQLSGMFINGPSNGTLTIKFARANGGGGTADLTLLAGSYLRLIPVGVN